MEKPEDNLENLFNRSFNDSDKVNDQDGWNIPSTTVWEEIEAGLAEEKTPERRFLYWHWAAIAASFLLLLSVFQLYQYNQKIQALANQLEINDQKVRAIQSDLQALNENKTEQNTEKTAQSDGLFKSKESVVTTSSYKNQEKKYLSSNSTNPLITKEVAAFNNTTFGDNVTKSDIIVPPSSYLDEVVNVSNKTENNKFNSVYVEKNRTESTSIPIATGTSTGSTRPFNRKSNQYLKEENNYGNTALAYEKKETINPISLRPIVNLPILNTSLTINISPIEPVLSTIITPIKKKMSIYLAADFSPIWIAAKNKGFQFGGHDFFPRIEKRENSFTTGLQFGVNVNEKWSIETGLRYTAANRTVSHVRKIPFHLLEESLNSNGELESTYNLALSSSGGTIDTDVVLSRSSTSTVAENTELNLAIDFSNSLTFLEVPLLVKRQWAIGRLGLSIRAGLLNRFLVKRNFEAKNIALDDSRFKPKQGPLNKPQRSNKSDSPGKLTDYSAHYLVGVGLAYHINPALSIYAEPTFSRSIQPTINSGMASIFSESKMVNVGLRYQL